MIRYTGCIIASVLLSLSVDAQHPTCEFQPETARTRCRLGKGGGYKLPGNFDVALLNPQTSTLIIGGNAFNTNVANDNCAPLPDLPNLKTVELNTFNIQPENSRFPLQHFLQHNKHRIQWLFLTTVKLSKLSESDFQGFSALTNLDVSMASLSAVELSTFNSLGQLPSGESQPAKLEDLRITGNPSLQTLDWSFLKPVAHSIKKIKMSRNGLSESKLTCSAPFILSKLSYINLLDNSGLTGIPDTIKRTFNPESPPQIDQY